MDWKIFFLKAKIETYLALNIVAFLFQLSGATLHDVDFNDLSDRGIALSVTTFSSTGSVQVAFKKVSSLLVPKRDPKKVSIDGRAFENLAFDTGFTSEDLVALIVH